MRARSVLLMLVVMAVLGVGAGGASAATLWTTPTHVTRVAVGATATLVGGQWSLTSGTAVIYSCTSATLNVTVTQNTDAAVNWTIGSGAVTGCAPSPPIRTFPWTLTVGGTATVSGTSTVWSNAALNGFRSHFLGGLYTGNLTTGVSFREPTSGTAPLCLAFTQAGKVVGPLSGDGRFDGQYCFSGTAATWSLTN